MDIKFYINKWYTDYLVWHKKYRRRLYTVLGLLTSVIVFLTIGWMTPPDYKSEISYNFSNSRGEIWTILKDSTYYPTRSRHTQNIEFLEIEEAELPKWKADKRLWMSALMAIKAEVPNSELVIEMRESSFGLTGVWTYELQGEGASNTLTIKENSTTEGIILRSIRAIMGRDALLKKDMRKIKERLEGE